MTQKLTLACALTSLAELIDGLECHSGSLWRCRPSQSPRVEENMLRAACGKQIWLVLAGIRAARWSIWLYRARQKNDTTDAEGVISLESTKWIYRSRDLFAISRPPRYRSVITSPLRSAARISPTWRPDTVSTAPFWLVSRIAPPPGPTAAPAPAAT